MPEPYWPLSLPIIKDSHGMGTGPVGLAGAAGGGPAAGAAGFGSPLDGRVGDLVSSSIPRKVQTSGAATGLENVNFYQLVPFPSMKTKKLKRITLQIIAKSCKIRNPRATRMGQVRGTMTRHEQNLKRQRRRLGAGGWSPLPL